MNLRATWSVVVISLRARYLEFITLCALRKARVMRRVARWVSRFTQDRASSFCAALRCEY